MKACVLASGSKGNCTYISSTTTQLLIDIGISCRNVEQKLNEIAVEPKDIKSILITHTHVDHINGLRVFIKKYNPTVYLTPLMYDELSQTMVINKYCFIEDDMFIDDIKIEVVKTSHDANDSNGYVLTNQNSSLVYITDTGYINQKFHNKMKNKSIYIIESNHDVPMLMNGKYPYAIKQRIISPKGHLSNQECSNYLKKLVGKETKVIILNHLSEENNTETLAYETLVNTLNEKIEKIIIARQKERTELVEI